MPIMSLLRQTAPPAGGSDGTQAQARGSRYGELMVQPVTAGLYAIANEGSYFKATNATFGTNLAYGVLTSFSATQGILVMRNTDGANGKRTFIDYIRFTVGVAPASATSCQFGIVLDNTNRVSANNVQLTAVNTNLDSATAAITRVDAATGATMTLTAAGGSARNNARFAVRSAIPAVGDTFMLNFGSQDTAATNVGAAPIGPVVLGPNGNQSMVVHAWFPGNATTALSYEVEVGWWER